MCMQRVLVYGSETWLAKSENMQHLERLERMMARWMCGANLKDCIIKCGIKQSSWSGGSYGYCVLAYFDMLGSVCQEGHPAPVKNNSLHYPQMSGKL